jgi:hypothetical protein
MPHKKEDLRLKKQCGRIDVELRIVFMGEDPVVILSGGDRPHLGAAALGVPRPSHRDPARQSASVSVLTLPGHRDDEFARYAAHRLAGVLGVPVLAACGIHVDSLTAEELAALETLADSMLDECEVMLGTK